ncbi:hypothetical protein DPQ33_11655 [Oceanidesulfovibrio indonesiensis]|uniref:Lipoprotein n=1 Tax=Oceanidesulfovibrio indonesiensis TaxID=54767 RepID=A0A7M3MEH2_9BACT|nr:hypothetical protein [Oceanidesulfovibrio indonesiensis]TVM16648.1 hypothetical protein DPQ33_11655 [Oceanidesulfovibrio indonesiensis]
MIHRAIGRLLVLVLASSLLFAAACSHFQTGSAESQPSTNATPQTMDNYYDFDDIPVPQEMELQGDASFILETPTERSGVMVFKGKVEIQSLRNYYINNMARENWNMRSAIKSSRTILVFEKPGRYCIVTMMDGRFSTQMEIWVTPRTNGYSEPMGSSSFSEQPLIP